MLPSSRSHKTFVNCGSQLGKFCWRQKFSKGSEAISFVKNVSLFGRQGNYLDNNPSFLVCGHLEGIFLVKLMTHS